MAVCDTCVESGTVRSAGGRYPERAFPLARVIWTGLEPLPRREGLVKEYKARRGPLSVSEEMNVACPRITEIRRASHLHLRLGISRMKKYLSSANVSGPENTLGQSGEVPSGGTRLLFVAGRTGGVGAQAERVTSEPSDRFRPSRAPQMK